MFGFGKNAGPPDGIPLTSPSEETMDRMAWMTGIGLTERLRGKVVRLFVDGRMYEVNTPADGSDAIVTRVA